MSKIRNSLEYHSMGRKGKIEVVPTKPCQTAEDLSLAYSPGVAEPCLAIQKILRMPINILPRGIWWQWFPTVPRCLAWATWALWPESRSWREGDSVQALCGYRCIRH